MTNVLDKIRKRIPSFKKRMMNISFDIVSQIFEYMKMEDMTQKELAKKMGKKESEISKWLSGGHNFTIETVAKIEEVLKKKILVVPMYALEDLNIKINNTKNIIINIQPVVLNEVHIYYPKPLTNNYFDLLKPYSDTYSNTSSQTIN